MLRQHTEEKENFAFQTLSQTVNVCKVITLQNSVRKKEMLNSIHYLKQFGFNNQ